MDAKTIEEQLVELREGFKRFCTGATDDMAYEIMAQVCATWGIPDAALLPRLIDVLAKQLEGVGRQPILLWLYVTTRMLTTMNGCELVFAAGFRAAQQCGVDRELVDKLRRFVRAPERGH